MELVDYARSKVLAGRVRTTADEDVGRPGGLARLSERVVDPVRHERERRAAGFDDGLGRPMRHHEDRGVECRLLAPVHDAEVSHASPEDDRPDTTEVIALEFLELLLGAALEHPVVQMLAATPHRFLDAHVRPRDVPVQ